MIFFIFFILGALTSLMYPPFFMFPLGFIIFPYLIILLSKNLNKKSFLYFFSYGFFFGFGFLLIYLSWIRNPFLVYEATSVYANLSILLQLFLSIFFGLGFLIYKFIKKKIFLIFITPLILIFVEFLISNFLYGFPWITSSLILSNNFLGLYLIKYFGTYTSGFLTITIFLLPCLFIHKIKFKKIIFVIYLPFLFILIFPIISFFSPSNNIKEITIDAHQLLTPISNVDKKKVQQNIIKKISLSESNLIIFAENNFPYLVDNNNMSDFEAYIKNSKKVIIGATSYKNKKFYNSLYLVEKNNISYFDKKILVPFGEFLPFRKYLKFMEQIVGDVDYAKGKIDRVIITEDNIKILPIICYEIIFDEVFKEINKNQIDIIINITNDSWFGKRIGPYQHFYITRIKSLIANRPIVRVSNNGITAVINSNGKLIKTSKLNEVSNINYNLKINNFKSYYNIHKLFFFYISFIFVVLLIANKKYK